MAHVKRSFVPDSSILLMPPCRLAVEEARRFLQRLQSYSGNVSILYLEPHWYCFCRRVAAFSRHRHGDMQDALAALRVIKHTLPIYARQRREFSSGQIR